MAEHGIEAADLKEIQRAAGARNRSAVHYHFGDREGLVNAIRQKHRGTNNAERNRILDTLEARGRNTIDELVEAFVRPMAQNLKTRSGRNYVIILGHAAIPRGTRGLYEAEQRHTDSIQRLNRLLADQLTGNRASRELQVGRALMTSLVLLADIAQDINRNVITERQGATRVDSLIMFVTSGLRGSSR